MKKSEQAAASKKRILDAAVRLFAEKGYKHSGVQEISEASGVSRGSIFWHFGSKEGLLFAVVDHCFSAWENEVLVPLLGEGTGPESIGQVVRSHVAFVKSSPEVGRLFFVMLFEGLAAQPKLLEKYRELHQRFRGYGRSWIQNAMAAGQLRADVDPEAAASAIVGALGGAHYQWLMDPERVDIEQVDAALAKVFERGLAPAQSSRSSSRPTVSGT
jgi:TetR/AcrR family acrAB operon transcriptional repressor